MWKKSRLRKREKRTRVSTLKNTQSKSGLLKYDGIMFLLNWRKPVGIGLERMREEKCEVK
jgi:hypothetical protein